MDKNIPLTNEVVKDALDQMKGAVMIVYPMGLPPHDPVRQELENTEDLSGTQVRLKVTGKNKTIFVEIYIHCTLYVVNELKTKVTQYCNSNC